MSQSIYKLTTQDGSTRYEMMSGERAQRKNYKREESKLPTRWLPAELEDVPNDAEIRDVSGKMISASELKGEDTGTVDNVIYNPDGITLPDREPDMVVRIASQPSVKPPAVDSPASIPPVATQTLPTVPTPASVALAAPTERDKAYAGMKAPEFPTWFKGTPATMDDDDLLAVWMEYETDPRSETAYTNGEFDYRRDIREEYAERVKMADQQKQEAIETLKDPKIRQLLTEQAEQGNGLATEMLAVKTESAPTTVIEMETIQTYQLVGTARVAMMTASEAKLLNANTDGEWIYAPELKQFAKPRKSENGEPKKRQKWRGISGTNLLMLCGSEGLSRDVAREVVKRLTGLEAADSTASVKMSEGRKEDADLPDPGREGWAEFYHTVGEVKKTIGDNGGNRVVAVPETYPTGTTPTNTARRINLPAELTEEDKEIRRKLTVISAYRLKFQTLLDEMQDELLKALTD